MAPLGDNGNNLLLSPLTFIRGTAGVDGRAARPLMTSGDLSHGIRSYLHHAVVRGNLLTQDTCHTMYRYFLTIECALNDIGTELKRTNLQFILNVNHPLTLKV